jgi:4-hydroxy-L-threonine phosphate dehydrogenase PdxA
MCNGRSITLSAKCLRAIVTAPLNNEFTQEAGIDHPEHAQILAARSGTQDLAMMLLNDELRVLLVTITALI